MVDLKKELEKIKKELQKIKEKQKKINYLQELFKKTKEREIKREILEILGKLLEEESLEEVVEPFRMRHDILQNVHDLPEIKREAPIIRIPVPAQTKSVFSAGNDEDKEEIKYSKLGTEYDRLTRDSLLDSNPSSSQDPTKYLRVEDIGERRYEARKKEEVSEEKYITPQLTQNREENIDKFSIENILNKKEDKHLKKNFKEDERW